MESKKIVIVAGEASGDLHAASLVSALKALRPQVEFYGLGGRRMREAGVELFCDLTRLSVVGFFEVIKHLKEIRGIFNSLVVKVEELQPDAVILVDYPGFNLRLAKELKRRGFKVIYYISPQIWAWGLKRMDLIRAVVDKMIVAFKFEEELYKSYGVDVEFVGHPLLDLAKPRPSSLRLDEAGLAPNKTTIALLPGSRNKEVARLLPIMLRACAIFCQKNPGAQFLLLKAETVDEEIFQAALVNLKLPLASISNRTYDGLNASDAAIVASGTATLQTAIMEVPMVITYKVSFLTWAFARWLIKIPYIGLANVVAGKKIVPECVQFQARPEIIAGNLQQILAPDKYPAIKRELVRVKKILGEPGASRRAAAIVARMLD